MSDMIIRSSMKDYGVKFIDDFTVPLKQATDEGAFVICDSSIYELYREHFLSSVDIEHFIIINAVEKTKNLENCKDIIEILVERKIRRNQKLIALGGGITQDVTAFIASILYRGVGWLFFPTTLLAQADSCIGSKTSINLGDKKNLIGNFYPPDNIYINTGFLQSLEKQDVQSGIGEMLHFFYYSNSPLIDKLINNYQEIIEQRGLLEEYIIESLSIKKSVIEIDEFDKGVRNKFNYGHTFGHALETITNYGIRHGQAVTIGMDLANYLSWKLGLLTQDQFDAMHGQLSINFPDYDFRSCGIDAYVAALSNDKKNIGDNLGCILSEGAGKLVMKQIPLDNNFKSMINDFLGGL